ncbi:hypothetical protein ACYATL_05185 [Actinotignum timonense]|uniref:hypothetical protein n=1 Tax=Actinotignum TaxID=1653174 RepID=UPI00254A859F|nr:hypothetical protein [Actinotignum timonense]MDK6906455.1 hypothetical protein [Actinotignum timonense]MDK8534664.1 hypothetical protein [Gleimia europaea]MDY5137983.1 hypothetical protein [Actinotignum timonense]
MSQEMRIVMPKYQATLEPPVIGAALVEASISYDGLPVAIWSTDEDWDKFFGRSNGGCSPNAYVDGVVDALLTRHNTDGKIIQKTPIFRFPVCFPSIQSLPSGAFLIVGGRCRWHKKENRADHNAFIYNFEGKLIRSGTVGDGIEEVQALSDGTFWTSYFDEGIGGNFGWGSRFPSDDPDLHYHDPIGRTGLVHWNSELKQIWSYPTMEELRPRFGDRGAFYATMFHVSSMNFDVDRTVVLPSTSCSIITIENHEITRYVDTQGEFEGVPGVAISGDRVLIWSWRGKPIITLIDISDGYRVVENCELRYPKEFDTDSYSSSNYIGPAIHCIDEDGVWITLDINDVWPDE